MRPESRSKFTAGSQVPLATCVREHGRPLVRTVRFPFSSGLGPPPPPRPPHMPLRSGWPLTCGVGGAGAAAPEPREGEAPCGTALPAGASHTAVADARIAAV